MMISNNKDYSLYLKFIEKYQPSGFAHINRKDQFIKEMELMAQANNQFFFIADIIQMKILFCSERSTQMIGVDPDVISPYNMNQATHTDDLHKMSLASGNRMRVSVDYFKEKKGNSILSTNFKLMNPEGTYSNVLFQIYTFYSPSPNNTVFHLQVHTNIDWYGKLKGNYHYYCGDNISKFRYPDQELLETGVPFTKRHFEIMQLIEQGMSSEKIAEKLFLSIHTVNAHRRNILNKSGKDNISDLIFELKDLGVL